MRFRRASTTSYENVALAVKDEITFHNGHPIRVRYRRENGEFCWIVECVDLDRWGFKVFRGTTRDMALQLCTAYIEKWAGIAA
jgi:hypothetical protein